MLISDDYKNNYDTVPTTANNSMGFDTKATQSYSTLAFGKGLETSIFLLTQDKGKREKAVS